MQDSWTPQIAWGAGTPGLREWETLNASRRGEFWAGSSVAVETVGPCEQL